MRPVVILDDAAIDLEAGRKFYEAQEPGLGAYFVASLLADIESLAPLHGIHSVHAGFHRMLASRFPFGIYYEDTPTETRVFAVLDLRRHPSWIRAELTGRK